jgi:hypothetical protein
VNPADEAVLPHGRLVGCGAIGGVGIDGARLPSINSASFAGLEQKALADASGLHVNTIEKRASLAKTYPAHADTVRKLQGFCHIRRDSP